MPNLSCLSTQWPLLASPPYRSFSSETFSPLGPSRDLLVPRRKTRVFRPLDGWPHGPHLLSGFAAPCACGESCFLVQHLGIAAPRPSVTSRQSLPASSCSSSACSPSLRPLHRFLFCPQCFSSSVCGVPSAALWLQEVCLSVFPGQDNWTGFTFLPGFLPRSDAHPRMAGFLQEGPPQDLVWALCNFLFPPDSRSPAL